LLGRRAHRGSVNLEIELVGDSYRREVFVKRLRRHSWRRYEDAVSGGDRPRLKPVRDPATLLVNERAGLDEISGVAASAGRPDWFSVDVVDWPTGPDLLVLSRVVAPTLAERISQGESARTLGPALRSLGALLHAVHGERSSGRRRSLLTGRSEVAELASSLISFIDDARLTAQCDQVLAAVDQLPSTLDGVPIHGDFAAHNVFVTDAAAVAVFDTSGDTIAPRHLDLAYFAAMLELAAMKTPLPSKGRATADSLSEQLLVGYAEVPPAHELRAVQILVLLDQWASLLEGRPKPLRTAVVRAKRRLVAHRLAATITRLLEQVPVDA
jgi:aminoglycoside phosphotransferase